ncbi:MAG: single-stranded DNA-binding protein [Verrucomicrobiota bacterium]
MSLNLNTVTIAGHLTRDPELRRTTNGTAVTEIGVATNRRYTDSSGQQHEDVYYATITFWGRAAETIEKHFHKGKPIYVEGYLKNEEWTDRESGAKRSATRIVAKTFQFLPDGKRPSEPAAASPSHDSDPY